MHPKLPRASSPARRSSGSVLPWRQPPLLAVRCCWAGLDWQQRLASVAGRAPRGQRLAGLAAPPNHWGAAGLDWQQRLASVAARSPRRQRLAVLHALPTHWGALRRAARLWPRLAEASSVSLARVSRRQRLGCARPATGSPTVWPNIFAPASARGGLLLEDHPSARPPKALVWLILRGRRAGRGNS